MPKKRKLRTSELLQDIADICGDNNVTVRGFMELLSERTFALGALIFGLLAAIVPAASVVFCIPVLLIGVQMAMGRDYLWLPKRVADTKMSEPIVRKMIEKVNPTLRKIEILLYQRWSFMFSPYGERAIGVFFIACSLVLLLPIPGLNLVPGLFAVALALAMLERDGMVAAGVMLSGVFALSTVYEIVKYAALKLFA